ncbi:hypothetical protein [Nocardia alni]|uniref:hypothetical protein n=1 Tax=Nocardia alni TaxID=2815723 RepID=UPI001C21727F|nr:hypothetical protein [Nocardia alni]
MRYRRRTARITVQAIALCLGIIAALTACASNSGVSQASSASTLDTGSPGDTLPLALVMSQWLTWRSWHGTRLPYADRWGPLRVRSGVATGFAHTPEGALLAMMQQQARLAAADDAAWPSLARAMAVVAPADQVPAQRVPTGFDTRGALPFFAGFHWLSYTADRAAGDLALQFPDGTLKSLRAQEVWRGSDWRAELPAAGGTTVPLAGLDGYQPWPSLPRP